MEMDPGESVDMGTSLFTVMGMARCSLSHFGDIESWVASYILFRVVVPLEVIPFR